jgi:hypothetical protein
VEIWQLARTNVSKEPVSFITSWSWRPQVSPKRRHPLPLLPQIKQHVTFYQVTTKVLKAWSAKTSLIFDQSLREQKPQLKTFGFKFLCHRFYHQANRWICSCWNHRLKFLTFSGDPTVFGNLKPPVEVIEAVQESLLSIRHNGYAPSTGRCVVTAEFRLSWWENKLICRVIRNKTTDTYCNLSPRISWTGHGLILTGLVHDKINTLIVTGKISVTAVQLTVNCWYYSCKLRRQT